MEKKNAAQRLIDFYAKRYQSMAGYTETPEYPSLKEMLDYLKYVPEMVYARYGFQREPLRGRVSEELRKELLMTCLQEGRRYARMLMERFPSKAPSGIAQALGITIKHPQIPNNGGHVVFAEFAEPDEMRIFQSTLDHAADTIEKHDVQDFFEEINLEEVLIAHELYHLVEMEHKADIFTLNRKITLWTLGPIRYTSKLVSLSEITAMSFAQELTGLSFSPYLFDVFLSYAYNPDMGGRLYHEIRQLSNTVVSANEISEKVEK